MPKKLESELKAGAERLGSEAARDSNWAQEVPRRWRDQYMVDASTPNETDPTMSAPRAAISPLGGIAPRRPHLAAHPNLVAPDAPSSDVTAIVAALKADLALDLHDSVARTLTMLVLRSEAALVRGSADDDDLEFIVRAAAEAAAQLRRALDSLGAEEAGSALRTDPPSLVETLALGQRVLRSQGFLAVITIPPNSPIEPATLAAFSGISAEAVHNMVKHGVPGSCTVDVDVRDGELRAMFANVATNEAREHGTITVSGLGMRGMSTRAVAIGGSVGVRADRTQWVVEVRLPAAGGASRRVR